LSGGEKKKKAKKDDDWRGGGVTTASAAYKPLGKERGGGQEKPQRGGPTMNYYLAVLDLPGKEFTEGSFGDVIERYFWPLFLRLALKDKRKGGKKKKEQKNVKRRGKRRLGPVVFV